MDVTPLVRQQPKWTKAKIIDPTFNPSSHRGRFVWVKTGRPEQSPICERVVWIGDRYMRVTQEGQEEPWYFVNLAHNGKQLCITQSVVELYPEFADDVVIEDIENS